MSTDKQQHTPGPWRKARSQAIVAGDRFAPVATAFTEADRNLVAAAPEMLAALEAYPGRAADPETMHKWEAQHYKAIRAAKGNA